MKWWPENCEAGDMIRVRAGSVWHYGIFVSPEEVIEFGPPPTPGALATGKDNVIMSVSIDEFSAGGIVEKAILSRDEKKKRLPPNKTIEIARSRIGEGGYDILHNNCEHFATACFFGHGRSSQEEALREKWLKRPILDIYLMALTPDMKPDSVYPPERIEYIHQSSNPDVMLERYGVWKLLELAVKRSFSFDMKDLVFKHKGSKWSCDRLHFSLSHCKGLAVVAVSNGLCGVDAESMKRFEERYSNPETLKKFQKKIASEAENISLDNHEDFIKVWTKKESIYKCWGKEGFIVKKINTSAHPCGGIKVSVPEEYYISYCGDKLSAARIYLYENGRFRPVPKID